MLKPILGLAVAAALVPAVATAATFTVTNTNASGAGSLAQAIADANATDNSDAISFNIAGGGIKTIGGVLPAITKPVTINGYTQPGAVGNTTGTGATNAKLMVVLDGSSVSSGSAVLRVNSSSVTIQGLVVNGMKSNVAGIEFATATTGGSVKGCFVGTDAAGAVDASAGLGIVVRGTANIGSDQYIDRNLVSGNGGAAIVLRGPSSLVRTNLLGTNAAGDPVLPNARGVQVTGSAATGNKIGDFGLIAPNVIAGNSGDGILLSQDAGAGNTFDSNLIHDNDGLSVDLGGDGYTLNDATDSDTGPNNLLNTPEIGLARVNGDVLKAYVVLRGAPGSYRLRYYVSTRPGTKEFGEMRKIAGSTNVTIGSSAYRFTISTTLDEVPTDSVWLSGVLTSIADGSTSEVSRATEAVQAGSEFSVTNTANSGGGSLRQAITLAELDPDPSTIVFEIPGDGPHKIALMSSLTVSNAPLMIDGYSQAGSKVNALQQGTDAEPGIELDGSGIVKGPLVGASQAPVILRGLSIVNGHDDGIVLDRAGGSSIEGSFVGVGADGAAGPGNDEFGIEITDSPNVRIGEAFVGARNFVGANGLGGIRANSPGARVYNTIVGAGALGNGGHGIDSGGDDSQFGGDYPGLFNFISGNAGDGIFVWSNVAGNEIGSNVITDNAGLGINLDDGGEPVTANDVNDADSGANALQNFPVLTSALAETGLLTVEGSLDVPDDRLNTAYYLNLYRNDGCDAFGIGEGQEPIGGAQVVIGSDEKFTTFIPKTVAAGLLTATITDPGTGNTSEFSGCLKIDTLIPLCGDANGDDKVTAGDALTTLKTAVGTATCQDCACDVNASGTFSATDALLVLRKAVGQTVTLTCPACS